MYLRDCSEILLKKVQKLILIDCLRKKKKKKKLSDVRTNTTNENFVTFYGHDPSNSKKQDEKMKKKLQNITLCNVIGRCDVFNFPQPLCFAYHALLDEKLWFSFTLLYTYTKQ